MKKKGENRTVLEVREGKKEGKGKERKGKINSKTE